MSVELIDRENATAPGPEPDRLVTKNQTGFSAWTPDWQARFTAEADRLRRALGITSRGGAMDIQHIGGTAVAELAGSNTIDILLITPDLASFDAQGSLLTQLGYKKLDPGDDNSQRKLILGDVQAPEVVLYIYQPGNTTALHHLLVRDFLRSHADERRQYGLLKRRLVERSGGITKSQHRYETGKRPRLTRLLERATGRG